MRKNYEATKTAIDFSSDEPQISHYWTANSEKWNTAYEKYGDPLRECLLPIEQVLKWLGPNTKRVLDAGCGAGYMSRLLAEKGLQVVGVDNSEGQIELARKLTNELQENIRGRIAFQKASLTNLNNLNDLPLFDGAVCTTVIENIENFSLAFSEINRKLQENARLVLTVIHPCFSMRDMKIIHPESSSKEIAHWVVDNYYERGVSSVLYDSMPAPTITFHRTLEDYSLALLNASFTIEQLLEPKPTSEQIEKYPQFLSGRGDRIPRFLVIVATKKGTY